MFFKSFFQRGIGKFCVFFLFMGKIRGGVLRGVCRLYKFIKFHSALLGTTFVPVLPPLSFKVDFSICAM